MDKSMCWCCSTHLFAQVTSGCSVRVGANWELIYAPSQFLSVHWTASELILGGNKGTAKKAGKQELNKRIHTHTHRDKKNHRVNFFIVLISRKSCMCKKMNENTALCAKCSQERLPYIQKYLCDHKWLSASTQTNKDAAPVWVIPLCPQWFIMIIMSEVKNKAGSSIQSWGAQ